MPARVQMRAPGETHGCESPRLGAVTPLLVDLRGRRVAVLGTHAAARARLARAGAQVVDALDDGCWLAVSDDDAVRAECDRRRVWCVGGSALLVAAEADELPVRRARAATGSRRGRVALVGGGPGDPGLLTVRGRRLLGEADVVVADALAPRALLATLDPDVEVVDAAKTAGSHVLRQEEISALLVARARAGLRVVRLKGGDPFVFGRGGEEAVACVEAGVGWEVVPGVTSAVAVPAYAGIPVTHRGLTQEIAVVSAHLAPGDPGSTVDWGALARGDGTLVLLMAAARLGVVAAALMAGGRAPSTPVAVVHRGTLPGEKVVVSTLAEVAVAAAGVGAPAVVVVGEVVRMREVLAWR